MDSLTLLSSLEKDTLKNQEDHIGNKCTYALMCYPRYHWIPKKSFSSMTISMTVYHICSAVVARLVPVVSGLSRLDQWFESTCRHV